MSISKFMILLVSFHIHVFAVSAMVEPNEKSDQKEPLYSFVTAISNTGMFGGELVIFVKKVTDRYLVTFDRKKRCDIFDLKDNYKRVENNRSCRGYYVPDNIFSYVDEDKQTLLVGCYHKKGYLYITNLDKENCCWEVFRMTSPFKFCWTSGESESAEPFSLSQYKNGSLIMVAGDKKEAREFKPTWKWGKEASEDFDGLPKFATQSLEIELTQSEILNDGEVVNSDMLSDFDSKPKFKADKESIPKQYKGCNAEGYIQEIYCYHKTPDGTLYCGHDGLITVWKQI